MAKQLFRSRDKRILGGVCGGIADYLDVDPLLVRALWVLVTLLGGSGFVAYVVLWLLIPEESAL